MTTKQENGENNKVSSSLQNQQPEKQQNEPTKTAIKTSTTQPAAEKKVQFSQQQNNKRKSAPYKYMSARSNDETRFGKADLKRDLGIMVGLLVFAALGGLTQFSSDSSSRRAEKEARRAQKEAEKRQALFQRQEQLDGYVRQHRPCDIYLAGSSIPGGDSLGLFAGASFEIGEAVMKTGAKMPIKVGGDLEGTATRLVSQHSLILAHHPVLPNVEEREVTLIEPQSCVASEDNICDDTMFTSTTIKKKAFVATRPIRPGDELVLSYEQHPQSLLADKGDDDLLPVLNKNPTRDDYEMAMEIVRDIHKQIRHSHMLSRKVVDKQLPITSYQMGVIKRTVARFNERVSSAIPSGTERVFEAIRNGIMYASLNNYTLSELDQSGHCMSHVELHHGEVNSNNGASGVFANAMIPKGALVVASPLLAMNMDPCDDTAADTSSTEDTSDGGMQFPRCLTHSQSSLSFCFLSAAAGFVRSSNDEVDDESSLSLEGGDGSGNGRKAANAKLVWSKWNAKNQIAQKLSVDSVVQSFATGLSIDIVATRVIHDGEEIILKGSDDFSSFEFGCERSLPAETGIFSRTWFDKS